MSYAYGGFSNIWGAACLPILKEETTDWPIDYNDLSKLKLVCNEAIEVVTIISNAYLIPFTWQISSP